MNQRRPTSCCRSLLSAVSTRSVLRLKITQLLYFYIAGFAQSHLTSEWLKTNDFQAGGNLSTYSFNCTLELSWSLRSDGTSPAALSGEPTDACKAKSRCETLNWMTALLLYSTLGYFIGCKRKRHESTTVVKVAGWLKSKIIGVTQVLENRQSCSVTFKQTI